MSHEYAVVVDERLRAYNFGDQHPLNPIRVLLTYDNVRKLNLLSAESVLETPITASVSEAQLLAVHTEDFVQAVRLASDGGITLPGYGLGSLDTPVFLGMHEAALQVAAATLTATQAVLHRGCLHAVNIAGGLHHAMPDKAAGFCVYNDIAISIQELLSHGYERIAYIDVDAHHGDGVERVFWDDSRVLTISIHESGQTLFPGTGFSHDMGGPSALGTAVNIALPQGTGDAQWLRAFEGVVPELLAQFRPQVIFSQHGCDSHERDPLTNLMLSIAGQTTSYRMIHQWAHDYAEGKWIAVGGGGYAITDVVPHVWTNLVAIVTHQDGHSGLMNQESVNFEKFSGGWDPNNEIDRIIIAIRKGIYPTFGLIADPTASF